MVSEITYNDSIGDYIFTEHYFLSKQATMVKSRAEINREYRQRQKEKDKEGYLKRERERKRKDYIPSVLLSRKERENRRKQNRENVRRFRQRRKEQANVNNIQDVDCESSGYESFNNGPAAPLLVALPFPNRAAGPRKRLSLELKEAKNAISKLKALNNDLSRKVKSEQRRRQRAIKRLQRSPCTPRRKAETLMNTAKLSSTQKDIIRKELVFGNAVAEQLREKAQKSVHMLLAGEILRKYRCNVALCSKVGLNKNTFTKYCMPPTSIKENRPSYKRKLEDKILKFMERDDNSRSQPGKNDTTKCDGEVRQTRVLTDYLENLHKKFLAENQDYHVSFATFCRVRPKYIQLSAFISRNSCLCTKHQNMALTIKAMRNMGIMMSSSPEKILDVEIDCPEIESHIGDQVRLSQWKRVEVNEKGKIKYVMRIVQSSVDKKVFIEHLKEQKSDFASHVSRVKTQFGQMRELKQNLPNNHVILQMDFSENYACKSLDQFQSAYWNQTSVTLHTVVTSVLQ